MRIGKRAVMIYLPENVAKILDELAKTKQTYKSAIMADSVLLYQYAHSRIDPNEIDLKAKLMLR